MNGSLARRRRRSRARRCGRGPWRRGQRDALDAEVGHHLAGGLELPAAAVDEHEVGRSGKSRRRPPPRPSLQAREAPGQHLAHHRVVVARREVALTDVELAVLALTEAFGAGHDHAADRVGPHDVGVVVDLDPARPLACRSFRPAPRAAFLAGGFRELADSASRALASRLDEVPLLAPARDADRDLAPGLRRSRLRPERRGSSAGASRRASGPAFK